jgi:gamma-D-glutamyl-L-lysine dipeptidyl-peptidase
MSLLIAIAMLAASVPPADLPDGVTLRPAANLFSAPSEDADVVSQAIYGAPVVLLEEKPGWARVRTSDNYSGWIPLSAIRRRANGERPYSVGPRVAQVTSLFANLYRETNITKHQPVLTVAYETRLELVREPDEAERRWIEVRLPDDRTAWIQRGDVGFDIAKLSIPETISLARRFLGIPYLWGGVTSFGYDCSGFTQMLCRRRGISIPRDAQPQAEWKGLVPVERTNLAAGDLIYFGSAKKITHTGLYIGDGEFIHATAHEQPVIQISRLADPHWDRLFTAARRIP